MHEQTLHKNKDTCFAIKEFPFTELTNSSRTAFAQCRKRFYWAYICRLAPNAENKAFLVGGLFHMGLEKLYKDRVYNEEAFNLFVDEKVDEAACSVVSAEASDDLWKQSALIKALVAGYAAFYLARDLKCWKVLASETAFTFKLANGWTNSGVRDLMVERGKKLELVEHKTTAVLDAGYMAKLPLDSQILGYALSCKHDFGRYPDSIVYNVCKKSQMRLKQTETMQQFTARMKEEYLINPSLYFYREILTFKKADIDAYEKDINRFAVEMARSIKEGYYYCNYAHCTNYGVCPYMSLCQARTSMAMQEVLLGYRVKEVAHEEVQDAR